MGLFTGPNIIPWIAPEEKPDAEPRKADFTAPEKPASPEQSPEKVVPPKKASLDSARSEAAGGQVMAGVSAVPLYGPPAKSGRFGGKVHA